MSLSTCYLEYGRHVARLRRRRRRAYAPTSNTASHDNHEKINPWVSFCFPCMDAYGAPLGGPSGRRSSAIKKLPIKLPKFYEECFQIFAEHSAATAVSVQCLNNNTIGGTIVWNNKHILNRFFIVPYVKKESLCLKTW